MTLGSAMAFSPRSHSRGDEPLRRCFGRNNSQQPLSTNALCFLTGIPELSPALRVTQKNVLCSPEYQSILPHKCPCSSARIEHLASNQVAAGSNPAGGTIRLRLRTTPGLFQMYPENSLGVARRRRAAGGTIHFRLRITVPRPFF